MYNIYLEVKPAKKNFERQIWAKSTKIGCKIVYCYFFKFGVLVFLEIEKDYSLEHCL